MVIDQAEPETLFARTIVQRSEVKFFLPYQFELYLKLNER